MEHYKGLITLDLENSPSAKERETFYRVLQEENWVKLEKVTTTWKVSFGEGFGYQEAIHLLKSHIAKAKQLSGVPTVQYAIQLGVHDVLIV